MRQNRQCPRTLIAGGAGFLGSHLCDRFIADGHDVICVDNFLTGRVGNIRHLLSNPKFKTVAMDVAASEEFELILEKFYPDRRLDYILNFASPASPKDYAQHPIATLRVGSVGTQNLLDLARICGSTFLLASTSEVYGDPEVSPQAETYWGHVNSIGPRSVYDEAKRYAEALTMAYYREYNVKVRVARIFNTYGERMRPNDGRALPNFVTQALRAEPLTVYGDGSQTRSLCYVDDLVEGLYRLLHSDDIGPVNLGNPEEISILDLARQVIELTGSSSDLVFVPLPADDPRQRCPDISRASERLGWKPQVDRKKGLERVIQYFRNIVMAEDCSAEAGRPPADKVQVA